MPSLPHRDTSPILLELDLTRPFVEVEPDDPIAKLRTRGKPRLRATIRTLHDAGNDPRVVGLVARVGGAVHTLAVTQELRDAVRVFASSGKPTVAWAETFGENAPASVAYYLATAFDEIWLQPSGELNLLGVAAEVQFVRGTLDLLGLEPQLGQRHEYKNAADRILRSEMSEPHREAIDRLTESAWEQIASGIAERRALKVEQVQEAADSAPLFARDALDKQLIDRVGYRDEVYTSVRRAVGGDVTLLFAERWSNHESPWTRIVTQVQQKRAPFVALVDGHGGVVMGKSRRSPTQGPMMGSDTVAAAIRAAARNDAVRAILFRVDSPGGSYIASDTIWREVCCARESGKPVVVSMGSVAGSGGYFVACNADVIVAQPGTLTGSIGVFGGKMVTLGLTSRLGLNYDGAQRGRNARMYSTHMTFSEGELQRLDAFLDEVYDDFVAKVADGRSMTKEAVHEVARGRVWTGADAAERGLVDELGGLRRAAAIARERGGLSDTAPVRPAVTVPPLQRLRPAKSSEDPRAAAAMTSMWASGWGEFAGIASALGLSSYGPLTMPGVRLG